MSSRRPCDRLVGQIRGGRQRDNPDISGLQSSGDDTSEKSDCLLSGPRVAADGDLNFGFIGRLVVENDNATSGDVDENYNDAESDQDRQPLRRRDENGARADRVAHFSSRSNGLLARKTSAPIICSPLN